MEYNFKKRIVAFLLMLSAAFYGFYAPSYAPKASAGLPTIDVPQLVKNIVDAVAIPIAKQMVDNMVKSTIDWANTGFEGGPAYVTNPESYFTNTADAVAGEFIAGNDLNFLCSPFQSQIRIALQRNYYTPPEEQFRCTLSEITDNIQDFYDGNFNRAGGWESWFVATQNPSNNPFGAYAEAKLEIDSRVTEAVGIERNQLDWNQGFRSLFECEEYNPNQEAIDEFRKYQQGDLTYAQLSRDAVGIVTGELNFNAGKPGGACITNGAIKTAGVTINEQLNKALSSGLDQLISVDQIEDLVSAFAGGLLQRYVFGDRGLFASDSPNSGNRELIDIDGDNIPDGYSTDGENLLACSHGLKPKPENIPYNEWGPDNGSCRLSKGLRSSPAFIPICENISSSIAELEGFEGFLSRTTFKREQTSVWTNRVGTAGETASDLINTLSRFLLPEFDRFISALGSYATDLDDRREEIVKNKEMCLGNCTDSEAARVKVLNNTRNLLTSLRSLSTIMEGRCQDPDTEAIEGVDEPFIEPDERGGRDDVEDSTPDEFR